MAPSKTTTLSYNVEHYDANVLIDEEVNAIGVALLIYGLAGACFFYIKCS